MLSYFSPILCYQLYLIVSQSAVFPDLTLIKRQYSIRNQRCDLLCAEKSNNQAVIIELKNEEDRGIVSQLIRYRKVILEAKSFPEQLNYDLPIKLIAVAPQFHEDNYTDRDASKYTDDLYFISFSVAIENELGIFNISNNTHTIPYPIFGLPDSAKSPVLGLNTMSTATSNFAGRLPREFLDDFVNLRSLFLSQPKVKELVCSGYQKVLYAMGDSEKHKKLAEVTSTKKGVFLYLWLPNTLNRRTATQTQRFGILMLPPNTNPFSGNNEVDYLYRCINGSIDLNNKPDQRTPNWIRSDTYFLRAYVMNSSKILENVLGDDDPLISNYRHFDSTNPRELSWFINLAMKTWNSFVK